MVTCDNLSLGWGGRIILEHLSFSLSKGDYLCVIGENGSGKTSLIRTLLGLNKPLAGSVSVPEGIGYLPQQSELHRDFPASVWEVVLSGCLADLGWRPFFRARDRAKARDAMNSMNILGLRDACFRELSGGQRQRVLLARALCAAKNLLVLDEPVSGLDSQSCSELYNLVEKLHLQGLTVIMITHDIPAALRFSSHILRLGRENYFFGTREEFKAHD